MNKHQDNLLDIVKVLFRWKKPIILLTAIAGIGAIVICLSLPNYYKATTVFYPSNPALSDPNQMFGGNNAKAMEYFGEEEEVDRLLSAAKSQAVVGQIVKEFDLFNHYKVDTTDEKARFKVEKKLFKLYKVIKNEYGAVELSVEDKDRVFAARMANAIRFYVDKTSQILTNQTKHSILKATEKLVKNKQNEIRTLSDSLSRLRKSYGIYDIEAQSELYGTLVPGIETSLAGSKARLRVLQASRGHRDTISSLKARISGLEEKRKMLHAEDGGMFSVVRFNEGRGLVALLETQVEKISEELGDLSERYESYKSSLEAEISSIFVEEMAYPPQVKSRPVRSIIVISATLVAFIFGALGALLFDTYKDVNWKEIVNASA